jgi:competence protein ComEC
MHIFAISGLHIVLISGMLWHVLRVLQLSRFYCGLLSLPTIWFYTAATGWQPSAVRATIMMSVIIGGWMLARPADMLNSVAAAALIILAFDPQQMFGASFQLSFFVVLSLALLMPVFQARIDKWLAYDPLLPPELATKSQRWQRWIARHLLLAIAVSVAAWLGAVPLTAYYFNLVGPVTLLANVLVVPTSNLALAANLGALFCGGWSDTLTELFNNCAWGLMNFIVWLSRRATGVPGGHWFVAGPSVLDCCLYYGVLIAAGTGVFSHKRLRRWAWAGTGLCIVLLPCGWLVKGSIAELTILPVQSGASFFVRDRVPPKTLLIDSSTSNSVHYLTKSFLRSQGCNRLEGLMLTHGDLQHVAGTELLEENFPVEHLYTSPVRFRSSIYRKIVERHETVNLLRIARGDHLGNWHVLHPGADDRASKADDAPLVLWGTFSPTAPTVLLLPDLNSTGQKALLEAYPGLQADVVIASPMSEDEFLGTEFLSTLRPTLIILQDAPYPHYERPSAALRDRLSKAAREVLYASEEGAITLRLKNDVWEVRTMRGFKRRVGKAGQNPAAVTSR